MILNSREDESGNTVNIHNKPSLTCSVQKTYSIEKDFLLQPPPVVQRDTRQVPGQADREDLGFLVLRKVLGSFQLVNDINRDKNENVPLII